MSGKKDHNDKRHAAPPRVLDRRRFIGGLIATAAVLVVRDHVDVAIPPSRPGMRWIGHC
jgi:hypothetical protein